MSNKYEDSIESIKVTKYGNLEIEVCKYRQKEVHTYYDVSSDIVKWLFSRTKEPTLKDIENKIKDEEERRNKIREDKCIHLSVNCIWEKDK